MAQTQPPTDKEARIFWAVKNHVFDEASRLADEDSNLFSKVDADGHSVLHWSALSGHDAFILKALRAGAEVDKMSPNGQTPLMWATTNGHIGAMKVLLDARASLGLKDSFGATPLTLAVQHRRHTAMLLLLGRAESKEQLIADTDSNGCTLVHWAAYKGDDLSLKLLEYFQANFLATDREGKTALHRACQGGQASVIETLIGNGLDPYAFDNERKSSFDIAETQHNNFTLKNLLEKHGQSFRNGPKASTIGAQEGTVIIDGDSDVETAQLQKKKLEVKARQEAKDLKKQALGYMAPCFWMVCVSLSLYQFLTEALPTVWKAAPISAVLYELGVPISLALFFYVALTDPGKVASKVKGASGVEEVIRKLEQRAGEKIDIGRLCTTTWVLKDERTKYCKMTGACVEEFDHFCGWLNTAIGKGNHRPFILLACAEVLTQVAHLWMCVQVALHLVPWRTNDITTTPMPMVASIEELDPISGFSHKAFTFSAWVALVFEQAPLTVMVIVLQGLTSPCIFMLVMHQLRLVAVNLTTNEMMNSRRYQHFWETTGDGRTVFRNPFDKGSAWSNCVDFWWLQRRSNHGPRACTASIHQDLTSWGTAHSNLM